MEETIFPPSPSWSLPNIISCREDGSVSYGSKNNIVILKTLPDNSCETSIIHSAHNSKVISVAFSPSKCDDSIKNTIASCSEDGFVKLWTIDTLSAFLAHKSHWDQSKEMGKIICLDWSLANPHHIVSVAENDTLILWDVLSNNTVKFSFPNLRATVISCCPYNEKIVAIGRKTGKIFIVNLTGNANIVYKLRGHDNIIHSLMWCPVPYNIFNKDNIEEEFLLASSCQDKEICVWRAGSSGKCDFRFLIPTNCISKKAGTPYRKLGNNFSFSALFWFDPYKIYFSSSFGELLYLDIKSYIEKKSLDFITGQKMHKVSDSIKLGHFFHSKGLFAIAGTHCKPNVVVYNSTEVNSNLKFEIQSNNCSIIKESEKENKIKWEVISSNYSSVIWTAGQDKKLVACRSIGKELELLYNLNTMNGVVYCAVASPLDPNKIAIGVGDGVIRLWNLTDPNGETQMYWQKIKDRVMTLAWHPVKDGILAYGTSEGRVGLIDINKNKPPNVFHPGHPQPIYNLSWGPQFPSSQESLNSNSEFWLYSVGDNKISVYNPSMLNADQINLDRAIQFPCKKQTDISWKPDYSLLAVGSEDGSICLVEPSKFSIVYTLQAYKKLIQSIAWHPSSTSVDSGLSPYHTYFTSGSTDNLNEIKVFNCIKDEEKVTVEQVASLKGHFGHIQSVSWSPHVGGRLISSSSDGSVQIWNVLTQSPLVNFTPTGMPMFSLWSPISSDIILTGCRNEVLNVWRVSKVTKVSPSPPNKNKKQKKNKNDVKSSEKEINSENGKLNGISNVKADVLVAEAKTPSSTAKEPKMFSKAWKRDVNDELKTCYSMLKQENVDNAYNNYSLPFLCDEEYFKEMVKNEEDNLKKSNSWNEYYELSLWKGNIKETVEEKIRSGQLNDFLVSLAPTTSPRLWQEACLSYSKILAGKNLFRKAASYLIACHKIYEAIKLLVDANLFLEALFIARSRLPKSDPMINDIVNQYAAWLVHNGSFSKACECYVYLKNYLEVAKVCGKKSQPEYLSLAALAARKCGSFDLESLEATNAILKCFESNNLDLAKRICDDHHNLKHLRLMLNMFLTIHQLDNDELSLEKNILSHVKDQTGMEDINFPATSQQLYHKYTFYKTKSKMYIVIAQELCFAYCAKYSADITFHLVRALSTCNRYIQTSGDEPHPLYKMCCWLAPTNFLEENTYFALNDSHLIPKVKSLRAFLCAGLVRYLNHISVPDKALQYLVVLNAIKDDLLEKDSYIYFKNLIEVEICEKRLLTNRNNLARYTLNKKNKVSNDRSEGEYECFIINDVLENGKTKAAEVLEREISESSVEVSKNETDLQISKKSTNGNVKGSLEGARDETSQFINNLDEKIMEDTGLLNRLKTEIENFEATRVSCPNPVPVYAMFKKILEGLLENELAKSLLESLESKWNELN